MEILIVGLLFVSAALLLFIGGYLAGRGSTKPFKWPEEDFGPLVSPPAVIPSIWQQGDTRLEAPAGTTVTVSGHGGTVHLRPGETKVWKDKGTETIISNRAPKKYRRISGAKIRYIQEQVAGGRSQYALAKELGVSTSLIHRWCHRDAPENR